jgi:hypothetical protein
MKQVSQTLCISGTSGSVANMTYLAPQLSQHTSMNVFSEIRARGFSLLFAICGANSDDDCKKDYQKPQAPVMIFDKF